MDLEAEIGLGDSLSSTARRVFALLSALSGKEIRDYASLSGVVKTLKNAA